MVGAGQWMGAGQGRAAGRGARVCAPRQFCRPNYHYLLAWSGSEQALTVWTSQGGSRHWHPHHRLRSAFQRNTPGWPPASSGRSLRLRPLPMTWTNPKKRHGVGMQGRTTTSTSQRKAVRRLRGPQSLTTFAGTTTQPQQPNHNNSTTTQKPTCLSYAICCARPPSLACRCCRSASSRYAAARFLGYIPTTSAHTVSN